MLTIVNYLKLIIKMVYLLPQEIEVWYIIPAIRKELAKLLTQKHKLSYEKTGNILGISKAAVSQYLSNKRANKIKLSPEIKADLEKSAIFLEKNQKQGMMEIEKILKLMKQKKCSCDICKKFNKEVLEYCNCKPVY